MWNGHLKLKRQQDSARKNIKKIIIKIIFFSLFPSRLSLLSLTMSLSLTICILYLSTRVFLLLSLLLLIFSHSASVSLLLLLSSFTITSLPFSHIYLFSFNYFLSVDSLNEVLLYYTKFYYRHDRWRVCSIFRLRELTLARIESKIKNNFQREY